MRGRQRNAAQSIAKIASRNPRKRALRQLAAGIEERLDGPSLMIAALAVLLGKCEHVRQCPLNQPRTRATGSASWNCMAGGQPFP